MQAAGMVPQVRLFSNFREHLHQRAGSPMSYTLRNGVVLADGGASFFNEDRIAHAIALPDS